MHIYVLTLFPECFPGPLGTSIIGRAIKNNLLEITVVNIRDFANDKHKTCDDTPYGGGPGMVMKAEPIYQAVHSVITTLSEKDRKNCAIIFTSAKGKLFNQAGAKDFATKQNLIFICGHYEGIDQRVIDLLEGEEISIGNYVLTGGELPAMVMIDSICRLLPMVLGKESSLEEESHTVAGQLEYPHYTKPQVFEGLEVPEVLLSGNHARIEAWRKLMTRES